MTDNYQFEKSNSPESLGNYSPFTDKQWNYVPDINSGVYQSQGLSLVTWDLSALYNSSKFVDLSECYITLPIIMAAGFTTAAGAAVAPAAGHFSLLSLKSNFINLVHQGDLQVGRISIENTQPYLNVFQNFRMLSEMSQNDIKSLGSTLGFSDCLDSIGSASWNGLVAVTGGNGYVNNTPFPTGANGSDTQMTFGAQNLNVVNKAIQQRVNKYVDISAANVNRIFGTAGVPTAGNVGNLMSSVAGGVLNTELKCNYQVSNNIMNWSDVAVIKVGDIFDSMKQLGMLKKFDGILRLYLNLGSVQIAVTNPSAGGTTYLYGLATSSFTNTIPFTINNLLNSLPATTAFITASCSLVRPPTTNYVNGANLATSAVSNPMTSCRFYYSQITLNPELSVGFIEENRAKKIVYRTILSNQYNNVAVGTFNQLINGGIKNLIGVLIVPMISSILLGFPQSTNPFDTFGATYSPLQLTNVNASIGGTNFKMNPEIYSFENFLEEVNNFESLTSADFGVSVGLINQPWWENNRVYYLSSRSSKTDKSTGRALNITFNNSTNVSLDVLVFSVYLDEFVVDVATGIVSR